MLFRSQLGHDSYLEQMAHHDCHTQQILSAEDDNKSKNNHATYQCCVGVIANSSTYQQFQESFLSQLVPRVSELPIDAMPEHIFKPPKKWVNDALIFWHFAICIRWRK